MTTVETRTLRYPRVAILHSEQDTLPPLGLLPRNPGMPLDLSWVRDARVNRSAVERRALTIPTRRSIKTTWQAGWLLRAITLMDLTTLQGDDTPGRVRRLCAKARQPVRSDLLESLGMQDVPLHVAAVCVYHAFVRTAVEALEGSGIPVAAVSTGFPAGLSPFKTRVAEIEARVAAIPGLYLAGNAYHGIGIPDCVRSAKQAAARILS